jgi:hypothetical protein
MKPRMQNGRPSAEAFGTPAVDNGGPVRVADTPNLHLHLVRVQSDEVAARGRRLVRLLTDLTAPRLAKAPVRPKKQQAVRIPLQCEHCGQWHKPSVVFEEGKEPVVIDLPGNCWQCGHVVESYEVIRDLIGTARLWLETAHLIGGGNC